MNLFFKKCHFKILPYQLFALLILFIYTNSLTEPMGIIHFILVGFAFSLLYFFLIYFIAMNSEEKEVIIRIKNKIYGKQN